MEMVLCAKGLTKSYRGKKVLDGVSMTIERGDIYGFVGENGSGKTTVIRLITGLIYAEQGEFTLFGISDKSKDIMTARRKTGAIVESPSIYLNMSAAENLRMQSKILGIEGEERIKEVLALVGLLDLYSDKKHAGNFSLGMRQRLGIAMALIGDPEFIILDEPMNGLDPAGIVEVRELILKLNSERGITFLISSHILSELSLVANKYGIISHGRLIKQITADELRAECKRSIFLDVDNTSALEELLSANLRPGDFVMNEHGATLFGNIRLNVLLKHVIDAGIEIKSVSCKDGTIEEYYLSVIGGARNA